MGGEFLVLLEGAVILIGVLVFFFLSRLPIKRNKIDKQKNNIE